ncbi:Uncharacterised protein [Vibrio cholerae]|nr:Uncharacterised protein [Vibrio cholerae]
MDSIPPSAACQRSITSLCQVMFRLGSRSNSSTALSPNVSSFSPKSTRTCVALS